MTDGQSTIISMIDKTGWHQDANVTLESLESFPSLLRCFRGRFLLPRPLRVVVVVVVVAKQRVSHDGFSLLVSLILLYDVALFLVKIW